MNQTLSGFVLYLTYEGKDRFRPLPFIARRLGRLYPPVFAATALSVVLVCISAIRPLQGVSPWFAGLWGSPIGVGEIVRHSLLLDGDYSFDSPLWSLAVEVQFSMLFPLLAVGIKRRPRSTAVASVAISLLSSAVAGRLAVPRIFDLPSTLQYTALFVFGALLAKNRITLGAYFGKSARLRLLAMPAAIVLTVVSPAFGLGAPSALGAIALTGLVAFSPNWGTVLNRRGIQFLGQISFSLYLTHLPVIVALVYLLSGTLPIGALLTMTIPVTLLVALTSFHVIERPSILLGRWLADKIHAASPQAA